MRVFPKILIALALAGYLAGCAADESGNENAQNAVVKANSNANVAKDNVEELETTVKLPFHPEEVVWREEALLKNESEKRLPAPNERKLTAVVKFKMEDADKIVAQAEKYKPGSPAAMNAESWYPAELVALTQMSGDETLKGTAYPANDFYQTPYTDGRLTRVENSNYFVLELYSK